MTVQNKMKNVVAVQMDFDIVTVIGNPLHRNFIAKRNLLHYSFQSVISVFSQPRHIQGQIDLAVRLDFHFVHFGHLTKNER